MSRPITLTPLSPAQIRAAELVARGWAGIKIAETVGVRPETVSRWKALPEFQAEIRRFLELARKGDMRTRAEALAGPALDALAAVLASNRQTADVRVAAAAAVLGFVAALRRQDRKDEDSAPPRVS